MLFNVTVPFNLAAATWPPSAIGWRWASSQSRPPLGR